MIDRIHSSSPFEAKVGYCRVVVAGGWAHVAGTVAPGATVEAQCAAILDKIETALGSAGCRFADVVRVTYMLPTADDFQKCWPQLSATFGAHPPAATMIECGLIDPQYLIEIEVTALVPD